MSERGRRQPLPATALHPDAWGARGGGLTTKIHGVVHANDTTVLLKLTEGEAHDGRSAADMLNTVGQCQIPLADRTHDSDGLRAAMSARGARADIKPMTRWVHFPAFGPWLYGYRDLVERFSSRPENSRAAATRFEKHDASHLALVDLAAPRIGMRFMCR